MTFSFQGWFTPGQVFVLDEYCARWSHLDAVSPFTINETAMLTSLALTTISYLSRAFLLPLLYVNASRYGVRGCFRHLCYLEDLLEKCEKHVLIDPTLIHFSYAYCASHVHGNRLVGLDITLKI